MRRPLCAFCLSALGVLALCSFLPQTGLLLPSAAIFVGFCLLVWWKGGAARGYAVCLLLGALVGVGIRETTDARLAKIQGSYAGQEAVLTAEVESIGRAYGAGRVSAVLRVETVDGEAVRFRVECVSLPRCKAGGRIRGRFALDLPDATQRLSDYADGIALSNVLMQPGPVPGTILHKTIDQNHELDKALDNKLIELAQPALDKKEPVRIEMPIRNVYRTLGTMLGYEITKRYGEEGLPDDTIDMTFHGAGGQSIGAFIPRGETIRVYGEVNDYAGKGLSGGRMVVRPEDGITFDPHENVIAGNVTGFGATSGQMFVAGRAGERFAVRNSGAVAVVEGVGDHCCEYMTGGRVVVLGQTGRNFAAGMSGGVAYVWNKDGNFDYFCNMEMVELSLIEEASYRKELHELIRQHYLYTGSKLARTMLDDWNHYADQFIQVVPIEYKKVLQEEQMRKLQQKIADMQRDY